MLLSTELQPRTRTFEHRTENALPRFLEASYRMVRIPLFFFFTSLGPFSKDHNFGEVSVLELFLAANCLGVSLLFSYRKIQLR